MILPGGLFFRIDHPAEGNAPGVIEFALGEHRAHAIFWGKNLDAEENGFGWVAICALLLRPRFVLAARDADSHVMKSIKALLAEECDQLQLNA